MFAVPGGRPRVAVDAYDEEPRQEFVKCVVIGDTSVGKTRLICSYVFNQAPFPLASLNTKAHIPTVFAIDHYMNDAVIHDRARFTINGVHVQLRIWDTFGDHEKNRRFAYQNAHVVVLCYSIGMPSSLRNINAKWYPEIKKYCPRAPIILVGTQLDRRHTNPREFKTCSRVTTLTDVLHHGFGNTPCRSRTIDTKLVAPEEGRQTAREIGAAAYMEVSIVTKHGVDLTFYNAVCSALIVRRHQRPLFSSHLKRIPALVLQEPYLPPKQDVPVVGVPAGSNMELFHDVLFGNEVTADVTFQVDSELIDGNCVLLIAASAVFEQLLMHPSVLAAMGPKEHLTSDMSRTTSTTLVLEEGYMNGCLVTTMPRGFASLDIVEDLDGVNKIFVKVKNVSSEHFKLALEFFYTGKILSVHDAVGLLNVATYLQFAPVVRYAANILSNNPILNCQLKDELRQRVASQLFELFYCKFLYADVTFNVDMQPIAAHRPVLVAQCEMMRAMFRKGNFKESGAPCVEFRDTSVESFLSMLEYLYTGDCRSLCQRDLHGTLQLANFLCLPRLVAMCEVAIVKQIETLEAERNPDVYAVVLASYNLAKLHNAPQMAAWCLHFMATNYNAMCRTQAKDMKLLDDTTKQYLEEHRYPPVWYLKEADYYERTTLEMEKEKAGKRRGKMRRKCSTCF